MVIFDEVQRVPALFSYLQTKVDQDRIMGQYVLSGSQNFLLLRAISQSLAGRVAVLKLLPLNYAEWQKADLLTDSVAEAIFQGGYPALYDRNLTANEFSPYYIETYLQRDVRDLASINDLGAFMTFVRLCAGRIGQPLNFENAMIAELVKNRLNTGMPTHYYFWQDSNGKEIDIPEETPNGFTAFEMKYTQTVISDHLKNLTMFRSLSNTTGVNYLLYAGNETQKRSAATVMGWHGVADL